MILDSQEQKDLILAMINGWTVPGNIIDKFYLLKKAITEARIEELK